MPMKLDRFFLVCSLSLLVSCGGDSTGTFRSPKLGEAIRIFPGDEVEMQTSNGNVVGTYTDEGDRLRVVVEVSGTKQSRYFDKVAEGLRDEKGVIFYSKKALGKILTTKSAPSPKRVPPSPDIAEAVRLVQAGEIGKGLTVLRKAAESGDPIAQVFMGGGLLVGGWS